MNDWGVFIVGSGGERHVIPIDDLKPHRFSDCWCVPAADEGVIVHNSMDRREYVERGEVKLQ